MEPHAAVPAHTSPARVARPAAGFVLVALVVASFAVNATVRMPCRDVCGSDIGRDYHDRGIDRAHPAYFARDFEYPPLVGEVMLAASLPFANGFRGPFLLNALVLVVLAALTTWLLWRRYGLRARHHRSALVGVRCGVRVGLLLGIGAAAKLFPALYLPILLAIASRRTAARLIAGFAVGAGAGALPVYLVAPDALRYFLHFHSSRTPSRDSVLFYVFRTPLMHPWLRAPVEARVTTYVAGIALVGALGVLVVRTAQRRIGAVAACALATIAFMVTNKIYSPQYDLWLVPFLVMLPVRTRLVVHFYVSSTAVWLLTAATPSLLRAPWSLYLVGAAVAYRLVVLALSSVDVWNVGPGRDSAPIGESDRGRSLRVDEGRGKQLVDDGVAGKAGDRPAHVGRRMG